MGAKVANPRKQFHFGLSIPGMANEFLVQRATLPSVEFDQVTHGESGGEIKTGGLKKVGNFSVSKLKDTVTVEEMFGNWGREVMNSASGGGLLPSQYKRNILFREYAADGITVVKQRILEGCWPQKINGIEFNRLSSDNVIEDIEFSVDDVKVF